MKKLLMFIVLFVTLTFSVPVKAAENYCYNLRASVGEDAYSVGINYHSSVSGTKLQYSKDSIFSTFEEVAPVEKTWSKGKVNGDEKTGFAKRYVCTVNLTGLDLGTTYYYRVVYEDYTSKTQQFKTANSTKTTFGVLCDTQSSGSSFSTSNQLVNKLASINKDINFFMIAGDIVDRGGYEAEWNYYDQYMTTINQKYLQATVPGNHELYHSNSASYIDATIYNQYYNNPKNGADCRLNSSYYFQYNDVLFIMLDTMTRSDGDNRFEEQIAWFKDVVTNNPASFVIVVSHPGLYSTGVYDHDAKIMKGKWLDTFQQYGVDLAISGHEHLYARSLPLYNDKVDTEKGVTYVIGGSAGQKSYGAKDKDAFEVVIENESASGQFSGSICEIEGDTLTFSFYRLDGTLKDTFTLKSKRSIDENFDMDEFMDSVHISYDEEAYKSSVAWANNGYGHVQNVKVTLTSTTGAQVNSYVGPASSGILIGTTYPTKNYFYDVEVTDYEGNTYQKRVYKEFDLSLNEPANPVLTAVKTEEGIDFEFTCTENNTIPFMIQLIINGTTYTMDDDFTLLVKDLTEVKAEDIQVVYFAQLYNGGVNFKFNSDNMEINLPELSPGQDEEPEPDNQGGGSTGGMSCNFGMTYVSTALLAAALLIVLKRKHN